MDIRRYIVWVVFMLILMGCSDVNDVTLESQIEESNKLIQELNGRISDLEATNRELEIKNISLTTQIEEFNSIDENLSLLLDKYEELEKDYNTVMGDHHPLEQQYIEEILNWDGTTSDAVNINLKYQELWKEEIEIYYGLLYEALYEDERHVLINSQEIWEENAKLSSSLAWTWNEHLYDGGSMRLVLNADASCALYRDRALYLIRLYGMVND